MARPRRSASDGRDGLGDDADLPAPAVDQAETEPAQRPGDDHEERA